MRNSKESLWRKREMSSKCDYERARAKWWMRSYRQLIDVQAGWSCPFFYSQRKKSPANDVSFFFFFFLRPEFRPIIIGRWVPDWPGKWSGEKQLTLFKFCPFAYLSIVCFFSSLVAVRCSEVRDSGWVF